MGILRNIIERRSLANPDAKILQLFSGSSRAYTGKYVNTEQAMKYPAFFACVRVIASAAMSVPLFTYKYESGDRKVTARNFPLFNLLHDQPHPEWTSADYTEYEFTSLLTNGNFYSLITRNEGGQVTQLTPIHPDRMRVTRVKLKENAEPQIVFFYRTDKGDEVPLFLGIDIHWVRGLTLDGLTGVSPIRMLMEAIALGLAGEEFGSRLFSNGASPRGVLEHPKVLSNEKAKELREQFERANAGLENSNRIVVLEEGMAFRAIALKADEAQFLETRKFQKSEIAGAMMVQPHKIGDLEHATFSNIEHQNIEFVQTTMLPWLRKSELAKKRDLLTAKEKLFYTFEYKIDGLLRGDIKTRYEAYGQGRQNGFLSGNDIRRLENMEPYEGGEEYWRPVNMVPVGTPVEPVQQKRENPAIDRIGETRANDRVVAELRNIANEAISRTVTKELKAIRRQFEKIERGGTIKEFSDWSDQFFKGFRDEITANLLPVIRGFDAIFSEPGKDPRSAVESVADSYISRSLAVIAEAISDEAGVKGKIDGLRAKLDSWQDTRSQELWDLLELKNEH